ncbi:MAG TPA: hypothetical protein VKB34_07040 [Povalibacter sp.]|nr:hypothetical protein [Povalibacter sp.]
MTSVPLILIARMLHVIAGILWAGVVFVIVSTVMPIARQHAKDGAERWTSMISQKAGPLSGIAAIVTLLSGVYLMIVMHRGDSTMSGLLLRIGALAGVLAFILGVAVARPLAMKLARGTDEQGRDQMRRRLALSARLTAALVGIAVLCMASFRYAPMLN